MFSSPHLFQSHLSSLSVDNFYKKWQQTQRKFSSSCLFQFHFSSPSVPKGCPRSFLLHFTPSQWTLDIDVNASIFGKQEYANTREFLLTVQNRISVIPILELELLRHLLQMCFFCHADKKTSFKLMCSVEKFQRTVGR